MSDFYNTKNKNIILDFFKNNENSIYTAKELINLLPSVPKATLYRKLEQLYLDKVIRKSFNDEQNCFEYQYSVDCDNHLHLKCRNCGKTIHLNCDKAKGVIDHIKKNHNFILDLTDSILYGYCKECEK